MRLCLRLALVLVALVIASPAIDDAMAGAVMPSVLTTDGSGSPCPDCPRSGGVVCSTSGCATPALTQAWAPAPSLAALGWSCVVHDASGSTSHAPDPPPPKTRLS